MGIGLSLGLGGITASHHERSNEPQLMMREAELSEIGEAAGIIAIRNQVVISVPEDKTEYSQLPADSRDSVIQPGADEFVPPDRGEHIQVTETVPPPMPRWYDTWLDVADCESGDMKIPGSANWSINTSNGYDGGLQFTPDSWRAAGGLMYAPFAYMASPLQQIEIANKLWDMQGWNAWPTCSRKLGLR